MPKPTASAPALAGNSDAESSDGNGSDDPMVYQAACSAAHPIESATSIQPGKDKRGGKGKGTKSYSSESMMSGSCRI